MHGHMNVTLAYVFDIAYAQLLSVTLLRAFASVHLPVRNNERISINFYTANCY
jgi:hypothetical protein